MKELAVYTLKCSDESCYVGVTNSPERRVLECNGRKDARFYTYSGTPVELVWPHKFSSEIEAIGWEKKIKGWTRKKEEALISENFHLLPILTTCLNETSHKYHVKRDFDSAQPEKKN